MQEIRRNLSLRWSGAPGVVVSGSSDSLRVMLSNLVDNALRYTPAGGHVQVITSVDGADAVLEVEDSGPGIAADQRERVFDRFYRVSETARVDEGSGLGLAIVKGVADSHQGTVALADGADGKGLRVTVRMPRAAT